MWAGRWPKEPPDSVTSTLETVPDRGLAPYLSDMMEQEKKVSYKEVYAAVGRDALAGIFGNFFWGQRPNRRRGNMAKEKYKHDPK